MSVTRRTVIAGAAAAATLTQAAAAAAKRRPAGTAPQGFWWGTAISAHQSEGNNVNSDFWLAENVKPTIFKEPSGDACDSYHRYAEDIGLAADLGFNAHRFGIEWSRIEPEEGQFSQAELDHYFRVLEECHRRGLKPMVTFCHWSVPRWFAARGGFERSDSPDYFARFAEKATARLGPLMAAATTFNEANITRLLSLRPGTDQARVAIRAMLAACAKASGSDRFANVLFAEVDKTETNQVRAHDLALAAIKAGPGDFPVGLTLSMQAFEGVGPDNHAAEVALLSYGPWLAAARRADFVGVQTYTRVRVGKDAAVPPPPGAEMTAAGYEFYPQALEATIRFAAKEIRRPIYVTENGIGTNDDSRRIAYIDQALDGVRRCIADGIDVRGYFLWSLLDNFEWIYGYDQRFGLVSVDRKTFKRTPKPSAVYLGKRARANRL
jgi:beta-glucosidase